MKIEAADSFFESIKKLSNRQRWFWKAWDLIRYDVPAFFHNIWIFRKALWSHRWYDWRGELDLLKVSLIRKADLLETRGIEIDSSRNMKVSAIRRAAKILENFADDKFIEMAESELGEVILYDWKFKEIEGTNCYELLNQESAEEEKHNRTVFNRASEIEKAEWSELWTIIKGQNYEAMTEFEKEFDGSGLRGWWD